MHWRIGCCHLLKVDSNRLQNNSFPAVLVIVIYLHIESALYAQNRVQGGAGTDLPKFKFSVKFPIGLHVILQLQIKKIQNCLLS